MSESPTSPHRASADSPDSRKSKRSKFDPPEFEPPECEPCHPRRRFSGWTAERQVRFVEALAETGCITEACQAVGMSRQSAYALRARADAVSFRNAWDAALDYAIRRLGDAVLSRAINGVAVPVFFQGEQIGEKRYYNDRLAMFLLHSRDPLRFGKWRDRHEFEGHPEAAAMAFGEAKQKVRADADLPCDKVGDRVVLRHQELAAMLWPEEPGESEEPDNGGT